MQDDLPAFWKKALDLFAKRLGLGAGDYAATAGDQDNTANSSDVGVQPHKIPAFRFRTSCTLAERGAGRQIFRRRLYRGIETHDLIYASHFKGLLDDPLRSNDPQFATCLLQLARAHDKDAYPRAIQIFQLRKIKNDLLLMLFQEIFDLPLDFLALESQGDSACQP